VARAPYQVGEFVGQREVLEPVLRILHGALSRGEPMQHLLFTGESGTGKSLAAQTLAKKASPETACHKFHGNPKLRAVVEKLAQAKPFDFVFFDEAHRLDPEVQHALYEVIDSGTIRPPAKMLQTGAPEAVTVPAMTLVFATDNPGVLLNALRKRVPLTVVFSRYSKRELREIVSRVATKQDVLLTPQAAGRLAEVSNGLPRRAEHHVQSLRLFFPDSERLQGGLGLPQVEEYLKAFGIDEDGLDRQAREYLRFLARTGGAVSLETIAGYLGTDAQNVRKEIEQPLRFRRLVEVGRCGRELTSKGREWVDEDKRKAANPKTDSQREEL
jgi:holliday junction DNA helicase RuvB